MILLPDENIAEVYRKQVAGNIKAGAALAFAHGFNVHYGQVQPRADIDVIMVAPKAPGHTVRGTYSQGGGVPSLVAVHQDTSGAARDIRSEEHTSELQSLMRISYAVLCLQKKNTPPIKTQTHTH